MDALTLLHGSSNPSGPGSLPGRMSMSVFLPPSLSPFHYSNIVKVNTQPWVFCRECLKKSCPTSSHITKIHFNTPLAGRERGGWQPIRGQYCYGSDQWEAGVFSDWSSCVISLRYSNVVMNLSLENGYSDTLLILPNAMYVTVWPYLAQNLT